MGNREVRATATVARASAGQSATGPSGCAAQSYSANRRPISPPSATAAARSSGSSPTTPPKVAPGGGRRRSGQERLLWRYFSQLGNVRGQLVELEPAPLDDEPELAGGEAGPLVPQVVADRRPAAGV